MTTFARNSAAKLFGSEAVHCIESPVMMTEDFGYYLEHASGTFWNIGAGCSKPLHKPEFLPAEDVIDNIMALHVRIAADFLEPETV